MGTFTVGIDPGGSGAAALLEDGREVIGLLDWASGPEVARTIRAWADMFPVDLWALEHVHSMPKQGVASTFSFGANFGWWCGALDILSARWRLVRPQAWQPGLVPPKRTPTDKPSLLVARRMFPEAPLERQKDHGRADALLLAYWAWKTTRKG